MFNAIHAFHTFLARALVAALLATGAGAALAGPLYHVTLDTGAWSGNGYLSLTFTGLENALPATATVTNFSGSYGTASTSSGQVAGSIGSAVTLAQGPSFNELLQAVGFGGMFSFDVSFGLAPETSDGAYFGVALVDAAGVGYAAGLEGDIAGIYLMPGAAPAVWADARFAEVSAVPEPGSAALLALALLAAACAGRRLRRA